MSVSFLFLGLYLVSGESTEPCERRAVPVFGDDGVACRVQVLLAAIGLTDDGPRGTVFALLPDCLCHCEGAIAVESGKSKVCGFGGVRNFDVLGGRTGKCVAPLLHYCTYRYLGTML